MITEPWWLFSAIIIERCPQLNSIDVTFLRLLVIIVFVFINIFARTLAVQIRFEAIEAEMFAADALHMHTAVHLADTKPTFRAAFDFLPFHKTDQSGIKLSLPTLISVV